MRQCQYSFQAGTFEFPFVTIVPSSGFFTNGTPTIILLNIHLYGRKKPVRMPQMSALNRITTPFHS